MATTRKVPWCDACKKNNRSTDATALCKECREIYCDDCLSIHRTFKATNDHLIIKVIQAKLEANFVKAECDTCFQRAKGNILAKVLCLNCRELYCDPCKLIHLAFKATKNHNLYEMTAEQQVPVDSVYLSSDFEGFTVTREREILGAQVPVKSPMGSTVETALTEKLVVIAVELGTLYSGYAYILRHEFEKDPTNICSYTWTSQSCASLKTSTTILLDKRKRFHSFGYQADNKYGNLEYDDKHHGWFYFRQFTMRLFDKIGLKKDVMLEAANGQEVSALFVFSQSIGYFKNHFIQKIVNAHNYGINDDDIHWVFTVPAHCTYAAEQFMREAASNAGINSNQFSAVLEPVAALLYCKQTLKDCSYMLTPRSKHILLDAGEKTVLATAYEVLPDGNFKPLQNTSGGAGGCVQVEESFRQFLIKIIGGDVLHDFHKNHLPDYLAMIREINTKTRSIKHGTSGKICLKIPIILKELFEYATEEKVREAVGQTSFSGKVVWIGNKMRIDADLFKRLFDRAVENIIEHVNTLFKERGLEDVNTILMVGDFSDSPVLQERIRSAFPKYKTFVPDEPALAVIKGAVLFGYNPTRFIPQIAK